MPFTKTGQYSIGATLNNGWCQENENNTWIKHGDYHNDQMVLVDVEKPGAEIQNNFDITVYSPPKESMPPPGRFSLLQKAYVSW